MDRDPRLIPEHLRDEVFVGLTDVEWSQMRQLSGLPDEDRAFIDDLLVNYRADLLIKENDRGGTDETEETRRRHILKRLSDQLLQLADDVMGFDVLSSLDQLDDGLKEECELLHTQLLFFEQKLEPSLRFLSNVKRSDGRTLRWIIRTLHRLLLVRTGTGIHTGKSRKGELDVFSFCFSFFNCALGSLTRKADLLTVRNALNNHLKGYRAVSLDEAISQLPEDRETARDNVFYYRVMLSRSKIETKTSGRPDFNSSL